MIFLPCFNIMSQPFHKKIRHLPQGTMPDKFVCYSLIGIKECKRRIRRLLLLRIFCALRISSFLR